MFKPQDILVLKNKLPRAIVELSCDIILNDAITGQNVTIPSGRRQFLIAKYDHVLWIFWKSGLSRGQVVGASMAYFATTFEERGIASYQRKTPLPQAA